MELSNARIVTSETASPVQEKAAQVLIEEIEKRTGIVLERSRSSRPGASIYVGTEADVRGIAVSGEFEKLSRLGELKAPGPEGYALISSEDGAGVAVLGADDRGVLFGVGRLLRRLTMKKSSVRLEGSLRVVTAPRHRIRGHQLGYRPKTNAYDAWSAEQFEQYIRDLALFGANSIEILPPKTDDSPTGPLMKTPPLVMMEKLSRIIHSYGLDVWIWYPNMSDDYLSEKSQESELAEREEIFAKLVRIDAVFIPGGDPGKLEPDLLFSWSEKVAGLLNRYHPGATVWLSPQASTQEDEWIESFLDNVEKKPEWLGGIVYGPWIKYPVSELRRRVPEEYPIRWYPDITHSLSCQYPVPNWDPALALTLGRECYNPRPRREKHIHNLYHEFTAGSLSYSEGINDDVNKFIWSDQDWDPEIPVIETLRDFARIFIDGEMAEGLAQGLMALEKNWEGPLAANENVEMTLKQWRDMETSATSAMLANYRFQMGLLRAYYDAYVQRRLMAETHRVREILSAIEGAPSSEDALDRAEEIIQSGKSVPVTPLLRRRCDELADLLFDSIGSQLTVERHKAKSIGRGAFMDTVDQPLTDIPWLETNIRQIRKIVSDADRLAAIRTLVNRTNPGPGGFYDNFGTAGSWRRIRSEYSWEEDPGHLVSPLIAFNTIMVQGKKPRLDYPPVYSDEGVDWTPNSFPWAWASGVHTLYDTPLVLEYEDVHADSSYDIRIVYVSTRYKVPTRIRLEARGGYLIHDWLEPKGQCHVVKFPVPRDAVAGGSLELIWTTTPGCHGPFIPEIWLIRTG